MVKKLCLLLAFKTLMCFALSAQIEVTYFMSTTCRICQFYTLPMRELHETYESRVSFKALFPGPLENDSTLSEFKKKYKLPFELALDSSEHYRLGATVTPEVAVEFNNKLIYLGRIDNSFEAVGKKRAVADSFELRNCLDKLLNNEPYALQYVSPIGCIIEKNR